MAADIHPDIHADSRKVRTAVVLQGGGALGAYELGVVKALYEQRPGFKPAVVAGTSIGAITAAVLGGARGDPIATLERLWRERLTVPRPLPGGLDPTSWWPPLLRRSLAALGNPGMYRLRPDALFAPWLCSSVYDTAPLRRTLADLVDLEKLNRGDIGVIVGALDLDTGEAAYFDNTGGALSFDAVVASGSLPPGFPLTRIGDGSYWDGGLFSNTPLSPAINFLEACQPDDPDIFRELIVVELFPMRAEIPRTLPEVMDRMTQLRYTTRLTLDRKFFETIDKQVDLMKKKIDEALPPGSTIFDDETYVKMRAHRKIDRFEVVTADLPSALSSASDFSRPSIEARIQAGYEDAIRQGIGGGGPVRCRR